MVSSMNIIDSVTQGRVRLFIGYLEANIMGMEDLASRNTQGPSQKNKKQMIPILLIIILPPFGTYNFLNDRTCTFFPLSLRLCLKDLTFKIREMRLFSHPFHDDLRFETELFFRRTQVLVDPLQRFRRGTHNGFRCHDDKTCRVTVVDKI